jgi:predicted ATPase/DNA-binding CsgD family transcriptional regulator
MGRRVPRSRAKRRHNLPANRLRLIGREQDVVAARQALLGTSGRLLTLTGAGGCGKTRLAVELATDLLPSFADGVWLIELAPLADAELVPQAAASALGIREQPGEALLVTLVRALIRREVLLVLDNCEHVIDVCARVVEQLLDECPRLRVLATSREALRITGERTWRVPSLRVPDQAAAPEVLLRAPAVQLFVERAQATLPDFDPTARAAAIGGICRRLDGLPLAIELAAARTAALGVDQILARLDDSIGLLVGGSRSAPTRQQTLRATLAWSYELLSDPERAVFRRLAVFADTFSLEAAEVVCADRHLAASAVLDQLQHLIDKSLVIAEERQGQARYHLLEPARQYAHEQLGSCGERADARRRHALYYLAFAEARSRDTNIGGPRRITAMAELDAEYPNIRAVLAWAIEGVEAQLGLRLAGSLSLLWQAYGSTSEGLTWLARMLALPGADEPTPARAWALLADAWLLILAGDFTTARDCCQEALGLAKGAGDPTLEWLALMFAGWNAYRSGDLAPAQQYEEQAVACARAAAEPVCEPPSLNILAMIACDRGAYAVAQPLAQEAVRLARATGDTWNEGWALGTVGRAALGLGALDEARAALEAGHAAARQQGQLTALTASILNLLGECGTATGQLEQARAWLLASIKLQHACGERWAMTQSLERLAELEARCGHADRALRLAGAGDALYERLGATRPPAECQKLEQWLMPLREASGNEAADAAWAHGRALDLEDAIGLALGGDESARPRRVRAAGMLTVREEEVAALLAVGLTNRQIAERLVITERTVAAHIEHILDKLGFASRHQVGAWAAERSLTN